MQMQVLPVIYDTLNTIRKVTKKNISGFQYHEIKTDDVKDLWDLCGTAICGYFDAVCCVCYTDSRYVLGNTG